jgi:hypothetical protein
VSHFRTVPRKVLFLAYQMFKKLEKTNEESYRGLSKTKLTKNIHKHLPPTTCAPGWASSATGVGRHQGRQRPEGDPTRQVFANTKNAVAGNPDLRRRELQKRHRPATSHVPKAVHAPSPVWWPDGRRPCP